MNNKLINLVALTPFILYVAFVVIPLGKLARGFSNKYMQLTGSKVPGWAFWSIERQKAIWKKSYDDQEAMKLIRELKMYIILCILGFFGSFIVFIVLMHILRYAL